MERNHKYFWDFVLKHFPRAVEQEYCEGLELDFWPSEEARDGGNKYLLSCHHDQETGELLIYGEWSCPLFR